MAFADDTPVLEKLMGGWWLVHEPLIYTTNDGLEIVVPKGFRTNLASIPAFLWPLLPRDGDYAPAAIIHDWLYGCKMIGGRPITKARADGVMLEAMESLGVGWMRRNTIWTGLLVGGWLAWWKSREDGCA